MDNIILKTDSYKLTHWQQYPAGTTTVYSYFESRRGATFPYTVFFGLQYILRRHLAGKVVTRDYIEQAAALCRDHFGSDSRFNRAMWERILYFYEGQLPLKIKAVPEGMIVPENNVMMTVENTDDCCAPLTNGVESLLTHVWYPCTVATLSHTVKGIVRKALEKSSDNMDGLKYMLHDFGYRGVSSHESAEIGGAAHLVNFVGTDTVPALMLLAEYYNNDGATDNLGFSVPATEHSIMTALGRDGEIDVVRQLIEDYPAGVLSVVGDSYNIYYFVDHIVGRLFKKQIENRTGVFVVRPDSVTPLHSSPTSQMVWILESLWKNFGGVVNSKGYKVICPKVRALWGDGINKNGIDEILTAVMNFGFSAENIATFGMGGGLLQKINRDTQRFAFKSSWQERNGVGYDIFKQPKDTSKISKKGKLKLVRRSDGTVETVSYRDPRGDIMETVFLNGQLTRFANIHEIRRRAEMSLT